MYQKDFKEIRAAQLRILMTVRNIQRCCTSHCGLLDKNRFMLFAGVFFCCNLEKIKSFDSCEFYGELNRCLYEILGGGYSLSSCVQFVLGRKGQYILSEIMGQQRSNLN